MYALVTYAQLNKTPRLKLIGIKFSMNLIKQTKNRFAADFKPKKRVQNLSALF